jgi:hypothetical protein
MPAYSLCGAEAITVRTCPPSPRCTAAAATSNAAGFQVPIGWEGSPKIVTTHVYPPIPVRSCDWAAHYDGYEEGGPYGSGPTEADAIRDLIENHDAPT